MALPGIGTERTSTPRKLLLTTEGMLTLPLGRVISGANSRDPANTGDLDVLRAGMVMGKRSNDEKYAPSILGKLTALAAFDDATLTVSAATSVEVLRRITAGGVFRLVGPRVTGEAVRTRKLGLSASAAGTITLAANAAVAEIQTSTIDAVMTAGTFTMSYRGYTTAAIAFDATVAQIQAALELLPSINSGDVVMEAAHEPDTEVTATWTFAATLGNVPMLSMDISNCTGPTTVAFAETTPGELVSYAVPGVAEEQTLTLAAGTDGGNFIVSFQGVNAAAQAWNVSAANLETALEAVSTIGSGNISVALAGEVYTLTFQAALEGPQELVQVQFDSTQDGAVCEGGITVARSVAGAAGGFAIGSLIMADDGSEAPLAILLDGSGIKVTDKDSVNIDVPYGRLLVGGMIDASQIIDYPTESSTKTWLKAQLNAATGGRFVFDDDY